MRENLWTRQTRCWPARRFHVMWQFVQKRIQNVLHIWWQPEHRKAETTSHPRATRCFRLTALSPMTTTTMRQLFFFSALLTCIFSRSISERTQPTEPSPLQMSMRNGSKCRNSRRPNCGPDDIRSNTWAGFNNCLKRRKNLTPWLSPDLELTVKRKREMGLI